MTGDGKAIKITLGINEECVDSRSLRRHKRKALAKEKKICKGIKNAAEEFIYAKRL